LPSNLQPTNDEIEFDAVEDDAAPAAVSAIGKNKA